MKNEINIRELLEKRAIVGFGHQIGDKWIDEILENDAEKVALITTLYFSLMTRSNNRIKKNVLFERYNITGIFDLSNPFIGTAVNLMLVILDKTTCASIMVGNYNGSLYIEGYRMGLVKGEISVLDFFPNSFQSYCENIEQWLNKKIPPQNGDKYVFNSVPAAMIDHNKVAPRRYSANILKIHDMLKTEQTVELSTLATVKRPKLVTGEKAKVISVRDFNYPFITGNLKDGLKTDTPLEQYDIIIKNGMADKIYLLLDEVKTEVYAGVNDTVIKPYEKELSAYLYFYMTTETGREVLASFSRGTVLQRLSLEDVSSYPIILPSEGLAYYAEQFKIKNYKNIDIRELYKFLKKDRPAEEPQKIEDILNSELIDKARLYKSEKLYTFLTSDFCEVSACYRAKAYKSALIMCGSILEAVLIDWLSEKDGKDYFVEEYMITTREGIEKSANLYDYINAIKEIERPNWAKEADYSHKIRIKRNLVHAKLCMEEENINEERCKEVIDYLKAVLKTRGFFI